MAEFDTTNATATADDILNGKTAYAKGEKIKGAIQSKLGGSFTPTTEPQVICPAGVYTSSAFSVKGDANLKPANIRKGAEIFGVEGNAAVNDAPSGTLPSDVRTISLKPNVPNIGMVQGGGAASEGMTITVSATPYKNAYFYGWKDGNAIVSNDDSYSLRVDSSKELTAVFSMEANTPPPDNFGDTPHYRIATSASPQDAGVIYGNDGVVEGGAEVSINATPSDGYEFTEWREKGQVVNKTSDYSFTAEANRNLVANFQKLPVYKISAIVSPEDSGSVDGAGEYFKGKEVSLAANPDFWYKFLRWKENGEQVSTANPYTFTVEGNRNLIAEFVDKLPAGYTAVEYIESDGKALINTDLRPNKNMIIHMDVETTDKPTTTRRYFFDSHLSSTSASPKYNFAISYYNGGSASSTGVYATSISGTSDTYTRLSADSSPRRMELSLSNSSRKASVDEESITLTGNTTNYPAESAFYNIILLGRAPLSSQGAAKLPAKLYSCTIYTGGLIIKDFVPCIDPSGVAGMYDSIGDTFYPSASSTPFTAGPEIKKSKTLVVEIEALSPETFDSVMSRVTIKVNDMYLHNESTAIEVEEANGIYHVDYIFRTFSTLPSNASVSIYYDNYMPAALVGTLDGPNKEKHMTATLGSQNEYSHKLIISVEKGE